MTKDNVGELLKGLKEGVDNNPSKIVIYFDNLVYIDSTGVRAVMFESQKTDAGIILVGLNEQMHDLFIQDELFESVTFVDTYSDYVIMYPCVAPYPYLCFLQIHYK